MRIVTVEEASAVAELGGVRRRIALDLCPEAGPGDYVLVHAGYAIAKVDPEEVQATLELLEQLRPSEDRP
jgi:hydrogenase expression/formation protein HypC